MPPLKRPRLLQHHGVAGRFRAGCWHSCFFIKGSGHGNQGPKGCQYYLTNDAPVQHAEESVNKDAHPPGAPLPRAWVLVRRFKGVAQVGRRGRSRTREFTECRFVSPFAAESRGARGRRPVSHGKIIRQISQLQLLVAALGCTALHGTTLAYPAIGAGVCWINQSWVTCMVHAARAILYAGTPGGLSFWRASARGSERF